MHILVTTDGSDRSFEVLPHAARLVEVVGGQVTLLRVLEPLADVGDELAPTTAEATERVSARWNAELDQRVQSLGVSAIGTVLVKQRDEDVPEAILRAAGEHGVDMIAMATRGTGPLRSALGSVASDVMGASRWPVMLTGEDAAAPRTTTPYRALVTTDGSHASEAVLPALQAFAAAGDRAALSVLRVPSDDDADDRERATADFSGRIPGAATQTIQPDGDGDTDEQIVRVATEVAADSIWMASQGQDLSDAILGSVVSSTIDRATVPVVVVPNLR